ncbi:MAG: hypothetical protein VB078_05635 [Clostridiaceae bacterium]|nr:hypothetical protein [Clostridiaceae bacterium]
MEWSKIKTILILLMLAVNIFLSINLYSQVSGSIREEHDMTEHSGEILKSHGFAFFEDAFLDMPVSMTSYTFRRDIEAEAKAAQGLLGECEQAQQGGGIYQYSSSKGKVIFRSSGYIELEWLSEDEPDIEALLMPGLNEDALSLKKETEGYSLYMDGLKIVGAFVSDRHSGKETFAEGVWVYGQKERGAISRTRAELILALGDVMKKLNLTSIDALKSAYILSPLQNGDVRLTPVWLVVSGDELVYVSALTGQQITS